MAETVRTRVVVQGRVQGVWYRESCRQQAAALHVGGYVRNLDDGGVEAEFEGPAPAVARAVEWCRTGPPRATVTSIHVTSVPAIGDRAFSIR